MAITDRKSCRALPGHAVTGACLGLGLLWGMTTIDAGALQSLTHSNEIDSETLTVLSAVFASYFAVGSGLTGFFLIATD